MALLNLYTLYSFGACITRPTDGTCCVLHIKHPSSFALAGLTAGSPRRRQVCSLGEGVLKGSWVAIRGARRTLNEIMTVLSLTFPPPTASRQEMQVGKVIHPRGAKVIRNLPMKARGCSNHAAKGCFSKAPINIHERVYLDPRTKNLES